MALDELYWDQRYQNKQTGWDLGAISPPLKAYFDQWSDTSKKILIPGAGNSYEAEYLHGLGFSNLFILDLSLTALQNFEKEFPAFQKPTYCIKIFFELGDSFDVIIEQTFFCALHPSQRLRYTEKMHSLLNPGGILAGLLFNIPLNTDQPPFGGNKEEYLEYFNPFFQVEIMAPAYNSIPQRFGNELFFKLLKR